ncbi:uncharacterized protein LOC131668017 [Phymastichus coffea]|uniref:uncharacterized protein LOC131668017 n=1 Tax=Phymastichus coffea TaxID=108790 RepID=UPI00273B418C|nr:uncharacterized protein LOC131668017 [Phymastichus coffea]
MHARKFDPDLEKLRQEVLGPPDLQTTFSNECQKGSQIHAAYLFEDEGRVLLQNLCLFLSATASGKSYGDWQKFAANLGLISEQIKCIEYDFKGLEDPTYYVLLGFVHSPGATLDKVLLALQKINRLDIINRTADYFNDFFQDITKNRSSDLKNGIYMPDFLPRAPLVLYPITKHNETTKIITKHFCESDNRQNNNSENGKNKYGSIIMLTFAEDGANTAQNILRICRSNDPRIGVIILQEQEKHVLGKTEEFIEDCMHQVNYIVPILTEKYLNNINTNTYNTANNTNLDSKYIRYIFSLMRYEYNKQGCKNKKVRCIVPNDEVQKVVPLIKHPILEAWFRESDIDLVIKNIILQKF